MVLGLPWISPTPIKNDTMNKAELIAGVQKNLGAECSKAHAERAVNAFLMAVEEGLKKDGEVQIVGFGTFAVKDRKARMGRNPQTKEPIQIKASRTVGFRPGTGLRASI
ncbi:MAG: DNA-binding protein HU-beta [Planctomycetota bacterium]|jgi:DNA-binding protein HU-beta